jgi:DNA-binding MarR family transcriptional regulator
MGDDGDDGGMLLLANQLCFPLYAAARLVTQAYRPFLEPLGLTYPQYLVLMVLWETDGLRGIDLCERLHLDSGTITPLLKRLESQGLITRQRASDDDRVVEAWLTEPGRALRAEALAIPLGVMCSAGLDLAEVMRIKAAVEPLVAKLLATKPG